MDFFAHQNQVRRSSRWFVLLFVLAVVAIVAAVDLVVIAAFGVHGATRDGGGEFVISWQRIAVTSGIVLAGIVLAMVYRTSSLRGGGATVARSVGATPVPADTSDPVWRRLRNIIEEVAIASGVPVPDIFVLEQEPGINAFAAGYSPADAAVCVTQGSLDRLTRDELQGVIAHEFSHVLNGDMRLNIRLMGVLFGILVIGIVGRFMLFSGAGGRVRSRGRGTAYIMLLGIAVVVIGYVGVFFGRLIQAAVARKRESLADASAVQYTRQNQGIAGALKKIAATQEGSQLAAHNKHEVGHMLFGEPGRFSRLFATHPPLPERLRALGVEWDDAEIEALAKDWQQPQRAADPEHPSASLSGFAAASAEPAPATAQPPSAASAQPEAAAGGGARASDRVGQPDTADFDLAGALRDGLPNAVRSAANDPHQADALLLALALDTRDAVRQEQLATIEQELDADARERTRQALTLVDTVQPVQRLPVASLAFPVLRRQSTAQLRRLLNVVKVLVRTDSGMDLHDYCLLRLLGQQLVEVMDPSGKRNGRKRVGQVSDSLANLLAIVATYGNHDNDEAARDAFAAAMEVVLPQWDGRIVAADNWQTQLDQSLQQLEKLRTADKQKLVDALAVGISADSVVTVAEAELLRVICASLACPLPLVHAQPTA